MLFGPLSIIEESSDWTGKMYKILDGFRVVAICSSREDAEALVECASGPSPKNKKDLDSSQEYEDEAMKVLNQEMEIEELNVELEHCYKVIADLSGR